MTPGTPLALVPLEALYSRFVPAGTKVKGIQSKRIVFDEAGVAREEESPGQHDSDGECEEKVDTRGAVSTHRHLGRCFCFFVC